MFRAPRMSALQVLREHRHPLVAMMLAAMFFGLVALLGECVVAERNASAALAETAAVAGPAAMPCVACSVRTGTRSSDDIPVVPATPMPGAMLGLLFVSVLFTLPILRQIPIPPEPLLPKRPRTLKFYALRI